MIFFFYEKKNLRCEVWDKVVAQKGALPPSKSSIGSKKSAKKKYENIFIIIIFYFFYFLYLFIFIIIFFI